MTPFVLALPLLVAVAEPDRLIDLLDPRPRGDDLARKLLRDSGIDIPEGVPSFVKAPIDPALAYLPTNKEGRLVPEAMPRVAAFRPVLAAEFELALNVCKPDKAARKAIARAGEAALARVAYVAYVWDSGFRPGGGSLAHAPNPRKAVQQGLDEAVRVHMPAEVAARYRAEVRERTILLEQAARQNFVARLDQHLAFSSEQRSRLLDALAAQWSDDLAQRLAISPHEGRELPQLPDALILPILDPNQKRRYKAVLRYSQYYPPGYDAGTPPMLSPLPDAELDDPSGSGLTRFENMPR